MRKSAVALALLLVGVCAYYFTSRDQSGSGSPDPALAAAGRPEAVVGAQSPQVSQGVAASRSPIDSSAAPPPVWDPRTKAAAIYATAGDLAAAYVFLTKRSEDPDALYFANEIVNACRVVYAADTKRFTIATEASAKLDGWTQIGQRDAQELMIARCVGWADGFPPPGVTKGFRARAAELGGSAGMAIEASAALEAGDGARARAIANEVLLRGDGYAYPLLSSVLRNVAPGGWSVGDPPRVVPDELVEPVLMLAGCTANGSCDERLPNPLVALCSSAALCAVTPRELVGKLAGSRNADLVASLAAAISAGVAARSPAQLGLSVP